MKKLLFVIVAFMFSLTLLCSCVPDIISPNGPELDLTGMELVFEDEFRAQSLQGDVWTDEKYWAGDHEYIRRGGYWDKDQCLLDGENLVIRTEFKQEGKYGSGWYTGMLNTRSLFEYKYGYFEIRCKAPKAEGLWSAFWLLADTYNTVSGNGHGGAEIDIMESPFYHDPYNNANYQNTTLHTIHIDGYGKDHKSVASPKVEVQKNMYDEFNTYGVLWTESEYVFYVNGVESYRTSFGVSDVAQYMILSIEIAGKQGSANPSNPKNQFCWSGEITNNSEKAFDFVIDYVKVYQ